MGIMHFSDYKQSVILAYQRLRDEGNLSLNLSDPTPASIKKECFKVLSNIGIKKDEKTFRLFFDISVDSNDYARAIEWCKIDRFKPLANFLKGITTDTEKKNIELLAWLINFKPRPYAFGESLLDDIKSIQESEITDTVEEMEQYGNDATNEKSEVDKTAEQDPKIPKIDSTQEYQTNTTKGWSKTKRNITSIITIVLTTTGIYWVSATDGLSTKAYICDRGSARKYHISDKCPALKNCKDQFVQTTIAEAEKNGKTLCGFEHK